MGKLTDDILRWNLEINGDPARKELTRVTNDTAKLKRQNTQLEREMAKLEARGKKGTKEWKDYQKQIKANNTTIKSNQSRMAALRKEIGLGNLSATELRKEMRALKQQMDRTNPSTKEWKEMNKQYGAMNTRMGQLRSGMNKTNGVLGKLKNAAGGLLPAFGIAAIVGGIIRAGKQIFNLTSQIQGEAIRSITVFGDQLGYVEDQAEKVAEKMGVTNREFVSMAANTADLLIPLDFTREQAAKMSTEVQGLAGALDEWTAGQIGVTEVSNILTKAMLGENEQLKRLGIAIRKDTLEYRDLVKIKLETENVTQAQAEAMATLELLYKKSADAQAAYLVEGNKLLRFKKSIGLAFKQAGENIAMFFNDAMESSTEKYRAQQREVDNLEKNLVPLIDRYETLSEKTIPLTSEEQETLNGLIADIARIAPGAITQFDEYGKAIGISAEKARALVDAQKAMLLVQNADAISDTEKALQKVTSQLEEQETRIKRMNEETAGGTQISGNVDEWQRIYQGRINKLEELGQKRLGLETLLKTLKGEPLVPDSSEDIDETGAAVTSLISIQESLLKQAKKMPETTEAEIVAKNRHIQAIETEIKRLKELGIEKANAGTAPGTITAPNVDLAPDTTIYDADALAHAEMLAAKKAGEEEWSEFLKKQIEDRENALAQELFIEEQIEQSRQELKEMRIDAIGQIAGAIAGMFEKGSAAYIAFFALEKAMAIAQVWMNYAKESAAHHAVAAAMGPAGIAYDAAMQTKALTQAGINTGLIVAQTIAQVASDKKKDKGYAKGGFAYEEQYVVAEKNKPEWISPNWMLQHPYTRSMINALEYYRQNPVQLNVQAAKPVKKYAVGGYTSTSDERSVSPPSQGGDGSALAGRGGSDQALLDKLDRLGDRIEAMNISISVEKYERERDKYIKIQQTKGL